MMGIAFGVSEKTIAPSQTLTLIGCEQNPIASEVVDEYGKRYFCLTGKARAEAFLVEGGTRAIQKGVFSELRTSYVYNSLLGIHGAVHGDLLWLPAMSRETDLDTDLAVLQVGNLATSPLRLVMGKGELPLGVNRPAVKGFYGKLNQNNFFKTPRYIAYGTFDDQNHMSLDFGVAGDLSSKIKKEEMGGKLEERYYKAIGFRFIYDFAILGSTRSVVSFYGEETGIRRGGVGLFTLGSKGGETHLELIRELATPDGKMAQFKQLIRLGYLGPIERSSRWSFQLDDEIKVATRGVVFYEQNLWDCVWFSQGVGYSKGLKSLGNTGWNFNLGLGTPL